MNVKPATFVSIAARVLVAAMAALALLPVPGAAAAAADDLWATVNVCDTPRRPNTVGLRASMPGTPRGTHLWMRFRVQYQDGDRWRYVDGADSGWDRIARARGLAVESGWSFELTSPDEPVTFRGVVRYRWRRDGRTLRRATEITEAAHRSTRGADPEDYSATTCSMA